MPQPTQPQAAQYPQAQPQPQAQRTPAPSAPFNPFKAFAANVGTRLADLEAAKLRAVLIEAFTGYFDQLDEFISKTNRRHETAEIWSTMTDEEIATLVDAALVLGKKNAQAAAAVRMIAQTWGYVQIGAMLGPRFLATFQFYAQNGGFAIL